MGSETTISWSGDVTTSNLSDLFDNATDLNNGTLTARGGANTILAEEAIKIIYLIIGSFGFISNIYVVTVIALYKPMHKQLTNIYITNQSIIDATVAFFLFFTTIFEDDKRIRTPGYGPDEAICRLWYTKMPLWGMLVSSTYGIVALTFERFLAVVYPIWHKTKFNRNKVAITLVIVWVIGPGFNMAYMTPSAKITDTGDCTVYSEWPDKTTQKAVGVFTVFLQFILPLIMLAYGYSRMALVLHRRVETAEAPAAGKEAKRNESMARARSNVVKTLATVAFFFIFCWTWNQTYYLMFYLDYPYIDFTSAFYNFTVIMVFLNCCVNPVIYSIKYEQFQRGVAWIFCRNRVRSTDENGATTNASTA